MTGSELRRLRRDHDLTQAEVAERLGVRRERIAYLEALSRVPPRAADSVTAAITPFSMTPLEYVRFVEKCRTTRLTATATPMLDQMPVKRTEAKLHVWRHIEPRQP